MIKIIAVGKIKEAFYTEAIKEYEKRLKAYTPFEIIEVKEVNTPDIKKNINMEGSNILNQINNDDFVITLEILGKMMDSIELAEYIKDKYTYGNTKLVFVIGGSNGLSDEVKKRSNFKLSFSSFTFPHQLMRVILMEQLYRSFTIINNKEYHK